MTKRFEFVVYDITGKRLCTLFDSKYAQDGAAYDIEVTKEKNGWKEITFTVPYYNSMGERNFRQDFVLNEHQLYEFEDGVCDIYSIKVDNDTHATKQLNLKVQCNHISEELKTKNLYGYFDDENGIGTCQELISIALAGTGWTLAHCDNFYETGTSTAKVRTYHCEPKTGAYNMISGICDIFKAHPVFDGLNRTVSIYATDNTSGYMELNYGKTMNKLSRKSDSSNIVTRLYVEGEYGDFGYVGIDDVNPTGLPFIFNFGYYQQLGVFTSAHQNYVSSYLTNYKNVSDDITSKMEQILQNNASLIELIGGCGYIYCPISSGVIQTNQMIAGGAYTEEDMSYNNGDTVVLVVQSSSSSPYNGFYIYETYSTARFTPSFLSGYSHIIKFVPVITGIMAAHEDLLNVSLTSINDHMVSLNKWLRKNGWLAQDANDITVLDLVSIYGVQNAEALSQVDDESFDISGIDEPYNIDTVRTYAAMVGDNSTLRKNTQEDLNADMLTAIGYMKGIDTAQDAIVADYETQETLNANLSNYLGPMLRDGYWSDTNYALGQEESLYQDALGISQTLAYPIVTYDVDYRPVSALPGYEDEVVLLRQVVRIYDDDLGIDDVVYPETIKEYPDNRKKDNVKFTTDIYNLANKTFSTMIDRISEMANDIQNYRDVYKRAEAITKNGKFSTELLEGTISTLTTKFLSASSNWVTDEKGNIVFTSLDGTSSMMLCGYGFMIASEKNPDGSWKWRTFGTGEGFTADAIITGFLSTDRLEANSIETNKLSSRVGEELNISSNAAINMVVDGTLMRITPDSIVATVGKMATSLVTIARAQEQPENPNIGDIWVEVAPLPSSERIAAYRWDGTQWKVDPALDPNDPRLLNGEYYTPVVGSSIGMFTNAINMVSDDITLTGNNSVHIAAGMEFENLFGGELEAHSAEIVNMVTGSDEYNILRTKVTQTEQAYTIAIGQINQQLEEMATWFTFTANGFEVGKSGSSYTTLTDESGFHILQYGEKISTFAKRQLKVEEIRVASVSSTGTRCVIREAYDGGLIIVVEG